jgi:hypothetical protein
VLNLLDDHLARRLVKLIGAPSDSCPPDGGSPVGAAMDKGVPA